MSKAEERYLDYCLDGRLRNCGKNDAFLLGYHQAEKDLELTWEDIEKVYLIAREVHQFRGFWSESVYQEVLKRYKDFKERKVEEV